MITPPASHQNEAPPDVSDLSPPERRHLLGIAHRLLGCHHLAEDALQESLWQLSRESVPAEHTMGWLVRAIVHRSRHLRRTLRRRRRHEHAASEHCRLHGDCDNPLHVAMAHELGERIDAGRASLSRGQQRALDLFAVHGKSYQQIAELLGVPVGTVRSRLARARQALEGNLQAWNAS